VTRPDWEPNRLKFLVKTNVAVLPEDTDPDAFFTYVDIGNVTQGSMDIEGAGVRFADAPSRARRLAHAGDSVVSTVRTYLRAVATVPESERDLVFSTGFAVLQPTSHVESRWLAYYLQGDEFVNRVVAHSEGVSYPAISAARLISLNLCLPPLAEQRAIADYLDHETAQIDALIGKQEQLIETLRERRTSVVARTLLRGLDPQARTTSDGSAALGPIPAHWSIMPARHLCTITTGDEDSGNATEDGGYPFFVRGREILRIGHFTFDCEAVMTPGDGQGGTGKVFHYMNGKFVAHQRVYVFTNFRAIVGWYFYYFLSTFLRPVALAGSNTVTMESLRRPLLADFKVALPPVDEQRRIVAYLDERTAAIDALISKAKRFIEVSKERRAALITAAVTGQIDVRAVTTIAGGGA